MVSPVRHPSTLRTKAAPMVGMGTGMRPGLNRANCSSPSSARGEDIREVAGPREENLAAMARLLAAKRGTPKEVIEVRDPADPDRDKVADDGVLLPGPGALLAGPTYAHWLDAQ
jgi:hypothetical protein